MSVTQSGVYLPADAAGILQLTPTGTAVSTSEDTSIITLLESEDSLPNSVSSTSPTAAAALQYIGAASNYPTQTFANGSHVLWHLHLWQMGHSQLSGVRCVY